MEPRCGSSATSSYPSSSSSSHSSIGCLVEEEIKCSGLVSNGQVPQGGRCRWSMHGRSWGRFPPLIPLLAGPQNLASNVRWVLRRHYTGDGRLILQEERVVPHEYFTTHRSNGRLRLRLNINLNYDDAAVSNEDLEEESASETRGPDCHDNTRSDRKNDRDKEETRAGSNILDCRIDEEKAMEIRVATKLKNSPSESSLEIPKAVAVKMAEKCTLAYSMRRSSSCIFGIPSVPAT